jgi:hypothetical protein
MRLPRKFDDAGAPAPASFLSGPLLKRAAWFTLPVLAVGLGAGNALAIDDVIEAPDKFLQEAFHGAPPAPKLLELDGHAQDQIQAALGHPLAQSRLRYWKANGRSAWIFDDIGKTGYQPTTAGFVVQGGSIDIARIIIYRESHGEEVAEPGFLRQFSGAKAAGGGLDRQIDGISGATLSVKMMQRMARAAIAMDALTPP